MEQPIAGFAVRAGDEVFDAAGDKIGDVVGVTPDYIVIEKGLVFTSDAHVPVGAIAGLSADGRGIRLRVVKSEALRQGWENRSASASYDASGAATYAAARHAPGFDAGSAALGTTGYMGESATSPGLAADLTGREDQPE